MRHCERRRAPRVRVQNGTGVCKFSSGAQSYRIVDVSLGGARLSGPHRVPVQTPLELDLLWFGVVCARVRGQVVRTTPEGEIGIEFLELPGATALLLRALVTTEQAASSYVALILVTNPVVCRFLTEHLDRSSRRYSIVRTPLEALVRLRGDQLRIAELFLQPTRAGLYLAELMRIDFPLVRRTVVGNIDELPTLMKAWDDGLADRILGTWAQSADSTASATPRVPGHVAMDKPS